MWYDDGKGGNIRLSVEDSEMHCNIYPKSEVEGERIWDMFRERARKDTLFDPNPFLRELLVELGLSRDN